MDTNLGWNLWNLLLHMCVCNKYTMILFSIKIYLIYKILQVATLFLELRLRRQTTGSKSTIQHESVIPIWNIKKNPVFAGSIVLHNLGRLAANQCLCSVQKVSPDQHTWPKHCRNTVQAQSAAFYFKLNLLKSTKALTRKYSESKKAADHRPA